MKVSLCIWLANLYRVITYENITKLWEDASWQVIMLRTPTRWWLLDVENLLLYIFAIQNLENQIWIIFQHENFVTGSIWALCFDSKSKVMIDNDYWVNSSIFVLYFFFLQCSISSWWPGNPSKLTMEFDQSLEEWAKDKPLSILQLDPADRAVLRIAGNILNFISTVFGVCNMVKLLNE